MNKIIKNVLAVLLVVVIIGLSIGSIELFKSNIYIKKDVITTVPKTDEKTQLITFIDADEELSLYPWDIFDEEKMLPWVGFVYNIGEEENNVESQYLTRINQVIGCYYGYAEIEPNIVTKYCTVMENQNGYFLYFKGFPFKDEKGFLHTADIVFFNYFCVYFHVAPDNRMGASTGITQSEKNDYLNKVSDNISQTLKSLSYYSQDFSKQEIADYEEKENAGDSEKQLIDNPFYDFLMDTSKENLICSDYTGESPGSYEKITEMLAMPYNAFFVNTGELVLTFQDESNGVVYSELSIIYDVTHNVVSGFSLKDFAM